MREPMNPRLIRIVAAQFEDLQGLRVTAWIAWICVWTWTFQFLPRSEAIRVFLVVLNAVIYVPFVREPLRRYYARRVGRVSGQHFPPVELRWAIWLIVAIPIAGGARPNAVLCLVWIAYPIYLAWSGWPYRMQHLLTVAVAAGVAVARLSSGPAEPVPDVQIARPLLVLALTVAVTGLIDHLVLTRTMRPRGEADLPDRI